MYFNASLLILVLLFYISYMCTLCILLCAMFSTCCVIYNFCDATLGGRQDADVTREIVEILHNIEKNELLPPLVVRCALPYLWHLCSRKGDQQCCTARNVPAWCLLQVVQILCEHSTATVAVVKEYVPSMSVVSTL